LKLVFCGNWLTTEGRRDQSLLLCASSIHHRRVIAKQFRAIRALDGLSS
jgi:hypothetical protein